MLPVFGSVASVTISRPRRQTAREPLGEAGSNTTAPCAAPRLEQRLERDPRVGTIATVLEHAGGRRTGAQIASVAGSGAGSTIASRTSSTSVRIA